MATKPKGFETRDMTREQVYALADQLIEVGKDGLGSVVRTHGLSAEKDGKVKLSRAHWEEIDDAVEFSQMRDRDLTLDEAIAGMQVVVIDEDGVHDGILMPDDSIEVDKGWTGEDGDIDGTASDEDIAELDAIMSEADAELDAPAFPLCHCGCGGRTKGGRYIPGHDAKHKGSLMRKVFYLGDTDEGEAARLELVLRGWEKFYPAFAKNEAKRVRRSNVARCRECGRPLSDEESVEAGIGPICQGRHS